MINELYKEIIKEKKLYSPGPVPGKWDIDINFSHRSKEFSRLVESVENKLRKTFKLSKEWLIIFTQGSGSSAIETVIQSLQGLMHIKVIENGTFGHRAKELVDKYKLDNVLFETSKSLYDDNIYRGNNLVIVDMVSALGYYPIPENADIVISSSSKILSGLPVMGIVFIKKKALKYFKKKKGYLDLKTYLDIYDSDKQTPNTPLLPQFISLDKALDNIITKKQIDKNCEALKIENKDMEVIGDKCPVKTIKVKDINKVLNEFKKYNIEVYYNPKYMGNYFQISMFNYRDTKYYELIKDILEQIK
jgi:aspartate aminotransferase-like enzyme